MRQCCCQNQFLIPMMETKGNSLILHHVGCVTKNIEKAKDTYINQLGFKNVSETFTISGQDVKICFIETSPGVYLELVEPLSGNPFLIEVLKSKNPYYHTGYLANNFNDTLQSLLQRKFYLVSQFHSEAFENRQCAFLYTPEMHLIELIENNR